MTGPTGVTQLEMNNSECVQAAADWPSGGSGEQRAPGGLLGPNSTTLDLNETTFGVTFIRYNITYNQGRI